MEKNVHGFILAIHTQVLGAQSGSGEADLAKTSLSNLKCPTAVPSEYPHQVCPKSSAGGPALGTNSQGAHLLRYSMNPLQTNLASVLRQD